MSFGKTRIRKEFGNFVFVLPALLLFMFVVAIPFINGIKYSFTNWDGFSPKLVYIGLKNYQRILSDPSIVKPILNSLEYTAITIIANNAIGLFIAILLKNDSRINRFCRTMLFMPFIISLVLAGFIWTYIYSDVFYAMFGIKSLLGNPDTVIGGISIMSIWRDTGYVMLIYLAGLQAIPEDFYTAAKIDGAGLFSQFRYITLPMISPAITINVTLFLGWGLKVFDYVMAATGGGPGRASETMALYVYNYTFPYNRAGYGQAAAILMMLGIFVVTAVITSILRKKEVEM